MQHRIKPLVIAIGTAILLGFFRESVFLNINAAIYELQNPVDRSMVSATFKWLFHFSPLFLYKAKWILTPAFYVLFGIQAWLSVRYIFRRKDFEWIALGLFAGVALVSGVLLGIGMVSNQIETWYTLSRDVSGWIQSPFVLLVLIASFGLADRMKKNDVV